MNDPTATGAPAARTPGDQVAAIQKAALRILGGLFAGIVVAAALAASDYVVGAVLGAVFAAMLSGATLGFLFGIPRSLAVAAPAAGNGQPTVAPGGGFAHNTNLEQISDWLTKIVVGIGLVEAQRISSEFQALSRQVAIAWGLGADGAPSAGFVLLASLLFGFIGFYIWTRTAFVYYLEYNETAVAAERRERELAERRAADAEEVAQQAKQDAEAAERNADLERERKAQAEQAAREADEQARQAREQAEQASSEAQEMSRAASFLQSGTVAPLQVGAQRARSVWPTRESWTRLIGDYKQYKQDIASGEAAAAQQDVWDSDPNLGRFGGQASADGRELSAQVQPLSETGQTCAVTIRVRSLDPARPLRGPVRIHLHPTFDPAVREALLSDGAAELRIIAAGVFTVGAEADDGATRLELNLADLPDLPPAFAAN